MELLAPELGILLWTLFSFLCLGLFLAALLGLVLAENMDADLKLFWTLIILFVPTLGPILFFIMRKKMNSKKIVSQNSLLK